MLNRLKQVFRKKRPAATPTKPHIIPPTAHKLSPADISSGALAVTDRLEEAGFSAFVVGGSVRDLLLDRHPKDFDVATNATPEEIKNLFRRAHIIGRRFQIVHVRSGRETIEVTTFRADHDSVAEGADSPSRHAQELSRRSQAGLLLRDNVFGSIDEDARRRDFTANALYYHPRDNLIYDYANGMADIRQRVLRIMGDPETRYREDPVRMLRAVRFAAKLGFALEARTAAAIPGLRHLLRDISPPRLFDEMPKLFLDGHGHATFQHLQQYQLFDALFPETAAQLAGGDALGVRFVEQALTNTDLRIAAGRPVTPTFLFAALLWPATHARLLQLLAQGEAPFRALQIAGADITAAQLRRIAIPRRFTLPMQEIWDLQLRLPNRAGANAARLVAHPRFRAAYDFVLLREQAGEDLGGLGDWWTRYQSADDAERSAMSLAVETPVAPRRPRRRRPRKAAAP